MERMPGITVDTAGCDRQKRMATSGYMARVFQVEIANDGGHAFDHLLLSVAAEIAVPEIALRENRGFRDASGERSFIQTARGQERRHCV